LPDGLIEQVAALPADRDAERLTGPAGGLVLFQHDDVVRPVHVGDRRPAEFPRSSAALPKVTPQKELTK
jgi:hypothetical protein